MRVQIYKIGAPVHEILKNRPKPLHLCCIHPIYGILASSRFLQKNESLRYLLFRNYLVLRFSLILSLNMQVTVLSVIVYKLAKSMGYEPALYLGFMGLAEVIPAVGFSIISGHFVDQREKRGLLLKCLVGYIVLSLFLLLLSWPVFHNRAGVHVTLWLIYGGIFIGGFLRAFLSPSSFALMGQLVPKSLYQNAATWTSLAWQVGAVLGPLLAGMMIAFSGEEMSMLGVVMLQVIALAAVLSIPKQEIQLKTKEPFLQSLQQGLGFVFRTQVVLAALSLDMFAVLFGGATALLTVFAFDILKVDEVYFGWLQAAQGIGTIITLLIISYLPLKTKPGHKLLLAIAGFGISTIIFAVSKNFWLSFGMLVLTGVFDGVSVVIRSTILQLKTPDTMRGRVAAVNTMFVSSSNEFGRLESGLAARAMGIVPSVIFGGAMTLVVILVTWASAPKLRTLDLTTDKVD